MLRSWNRPGCQTGFHHGMVVWAMVEGRPLAWEFKSCICPWCLKLTLFSSTASLVFSCPNAQAGSLFPSVCSCLWKLLSQLTPMPPFFEDKLVLSYTVFCIGFQIFDVWSFWSIFQLHWIPTVTLETIKPYFSCLISCSEAVSEILLECLNHTMAGVEVGECHVKGLQETNQ